MKKKAKQEVLESELKIFQKKKNQSKSKPNQNRKPKQNRARLLTSKPKIKKSLAEVAGCKHTSLALHIFNNFGTVVRLLSSFFLAPPLLSSFFSPSFLFFFFYNKTRKKNPFDKPNEQVILKMCIGKDKPFYKKPNKHIIMKNKNVKTQKILTYPLL